MIEPNTHKADDPSVKVFFETDCTITNPENGQKFEAGGAVVTPDYVIAYPDKGGVLRTWHGQIIGSWRSVSSWRVHSFIGERMHQIEATAEFDGKVVTYTGRGFGAGMIYKGKRKKEKTRR